MAENKDGMEKTEQATRKRLDDARDRGQVAKSTDVTTAGLLLIGGLSIFVFGNFMSDLYLGFMTTVFANIHTFEVTDQNLFVYFDRLMEFLGLILFPILATVFLISLAGEVFQVGFKLAPKKFTEGLKFDQVFNPFKNLKKIFFSINSIFELAKSIVKIVILGLVVYIVLNGKSEEIVGLLDRPFMDIGVFMADISLELVWKVGLVYILIALIDFYYQKWKFAEDMKMTKRELKDENKQTEGDPMVKARLRQLMRGKLRNAMLKNSEQADVVITNPTHFAVAIKYKQGEDDAPVVVAKGADFLAAKIREVASENNIPLYEDPPLARLIFFNVEVDDEIPESMFKAVAQVLAFVFSAKMSNS